MIDQIVSINVEAHDIIQIELHHKWAGCLAVVQEVKPWGVQAYVRIPSNDGAPPGDAYIRLAWEGFLVIGAKAQLVPGRDEPEHPQVEGEGHE